MLDLQLTLSNDADSRFVCRLNKLEVGHPNTVVFGSIRDKLILQAHHNWKDLLLNLEEFDQAVKESFRFLSVQTLLSREAMENAKHTYKWNKRTS